jgi:uncharacterized membrane protein
MGHVEESIEVAVPLSVAYNQWTQFEEFPNFMEGVEQVRQLDDAHLHWRTRIAGVTRDFDAQITEQRPDERIAWRSTEGTTHAGDVTFQRVDDGRTRIAVRIDEEPDDLIEKVGDVLGLLRRRVKGDLERFKEMIEARGHETGAWRGELGGSEERRFNRAGEEAPMDADLGPGGTEATSGSPGDIPVREQGGL